MNEEEEALDETTTKKITKDEDKVVDASNNNAKKSEKSKEADDDDDDDDDDDEGDDDASGDDENEDTGKGDGGSEKTKKKKKKVKRFTEEELEKYKTNTMEFLKETVKEVMGLPLDERFNEQSHMHRIIRNSFIRFQKAYFGINRASLEEIVAFRQAVAELMVETRYYDVCCECLVRTLRYTPTDDFQNGTVDAKLYSPLINAQLVIMNFTDCSETLRVAVAKFMGYLEAYKGFLDRFEMRHKGFEKPVPSVSPFP